MNKILLFTVSLVFFLPGCYPVEEKHSPVLESLEITPASPTTHDDLICSVRATDQDGNLSTLEFEWFANNLSLRSQTKSIKRSSVAVQDVLPSSQTSSGDTVKCKVTVFDTDGKSTAGSDSVNIQPNTSPTISEIPDQTVTVGEGINIIDLWNYTSDNEDSDSALDFRIVQQSDTSIINCYLDENRYVKSNDAQKTGHSDITVEVTDSGSLSDTDTFRITVEPVPNTSPIISGIPDQIVTLGHNVESIDLWDYASDKEDIDSALTFVIESQSNSEVVNCFIEGNRFLKSENAEAVGDSDITVKVIDSKGLSSTDTFGITVEPVPNTSPIISGIPDQIVILGYSIDPIDLWNYASDNEDPDSALVFSIESQSNLEAIDCFIKSNQFLNSEESKNTGFSDITVKVTDSGKLSSTDIFRITIESPAYKLHGLDFSPYMDGQDPNLGSIISEQQIRERMTIIAPFTEWIRSFGSTHGLENIGRIAREFNLKTAIGAWLDSDLQTNKTEMENLIDAAKNGYIDLAIVGSEVLLRNDLTEDQLIDYIEQFRREVPWIPVTSGETYGELLSHPNLMDACDVIFVNYYPYWEGIDINQAVAYIHARHQEVVSKVNGKEVIVSEIGWPSNGNQIVNAIPSLENACFYFLNFVSWARAEGVSYFYFEAFDEEWKAAYEGPQGAHWGVWDKYGNMKSCMQDVFNGQTIPDNWTCEEMPGGSGNPAIEFTYVPFYGSFENLEGQVWHVWPEDYRVAVYIYVDGLGWWTKPYWNNPLTVIECDGKWVCDITTGGLDTEATKIIAYLVPLGYDPPFVGGQRTLPGELEQNAVAWIETTRIN